MTRCSPTILLQGGVGSLVGQLLKNVYGCKVVGSAGSDDKVGTAQCFCASS